MIQVVSKILLIGMLLLVVLFVGCDVDPVRPRPAEGLVGAWRWIEICPWLAEDCLTPETEGYTRRISFSSDSVYRDWVNDTLIIETGYSVIRREISPGDTLEMLLVDDFTGEQFINFHARDTLRLTPDAPRPATTGFIRLGDI